MTLSGDESIAGPVVVQRAAKPLLGNVRKLVRDQASRQRVPELVGPRLNVHMFAFRQCDGARTPRAAPAVVIRVDTDGTEVEPQDALCVLTALGRQRPGSMGCRLQAPPDSALSRGSGPDLIGLGFVARADGN
ncbi:hypothetical protein A8M77_11270 [Variovorax sp. JS1663]|nr:hypothetical protein A8M77_11270 [Variovorax sp. JS1663]